MKRYRSKRGQRVGRWLLEGPLGIGGNAEVWRANAAKGDRAAVKILWATSPQSEPYRRFKDEVEILGRLGKRPGVLTLLDADVPDHPSRERPAWFSMPIAIRIKEALGDSPELDELVRAIAAIARTLAGLLEEEGISHRDIKPSNLFLFDGQWTLSDFGLAAFPGKQELTVADRRLGPRDFIAPEMLDRPDTAEEGPADVYSLAKTLWVLATRKPLPPQGQVRLDIATHRIANYISHPRVHFLDRLLTVATDEDPKARLSMAQFAQELEAWLDVRVPRWKGPNLTGIRNRIYESLPADPKRDIEYDLPPLELAEGLVSWFGARLQILADDLSLVAPCDGRVHDDEAVITRFIGTARLQESLVVWRGGRCVVVKGPMVAKPATHPYPPILTIGIGLELREDGNMLIRAAHILSRRDGLFEVLWSDERIVVPGWPSEALAAEDLLGGLGKGLGRQLRRFAKEVEASVP